MPNIKIRMVRKYLSIFASLTFAANCFSAVPALAGKKFADSNALVSKIAANRDFFIGFKPQHISGLGEALLCDVTELGDGRVGLLLLLKPSGMLRSAVFQQETGRVLHEKLIALPQNTRKELARGGISISDACLIAKKLAASPWKARIAE